jgi:hypothetical protein
LHKCSTKERLAHKHIEEYLQMDERIEHVLQEFGYKLVEDASTIEGRKTYLNSEDADRTFLKDLERVLAGHNWRKHETMLRAFRNASGELLEIEVGGPETSGHFIHHLKSE